MLQTGEVGHFLSKCGFNFYSGVPCSFLKDLINYAINEEDFIMAANEGDAVAIASGAYLGGRKSVFLCQNSGLANAVSPLTSLTYTFKIPLLGFVSLRGESGLKDEPQHELMGQITSELLTTMRIRHAILSKDPTEALKQLKIADEWIEQGESYFFIVQKGTFEKVILKEQTKQSKITPIINNHGDSIRPTRYEVLEQVVETIEVEDAIILATTGLTGRELWEINDRDNQLYMVGSMGAVSSIGLGLALARPDKKVIAIDGDGALLMRLGAMSTIGYYRPSNLYHLLLDNGAHESTGGQFTVAPVVNFNQIAEATNYEQIEKMGSLTDLNHSLKEWLKEERLTFSYIKTKTGVNPELGRPTITPFQVKERLIRFLLEEKI